MEKVNMDCYLFLCDKDGENIKFQKNDFVEIKLKHSCMYEKDPDGGYDRPVYLVKGRLTSWSNNSLELDISRPYDAETVSIAFMKIESIKITDNTERTSHYA